MAKGFSFYIVKAIMVKAIVNGRADDVIQPARTNLRR